jgi:hypothetical protein
MSKNGKMMDEPECAGFGGDVKKPPSEKHLVD